MAKGYFVLVQREDHSGWWVLDLYATTKAEATSTIRWQKRGYPNAACSLCVHDQGAEFVELDGLRRRITPDRGPYTQEAWDNFLASLKAEV